jgi:hypothetical protein
VLLASPFGFGSSGRGGKVINRKGLTRSILLVACGPAQTRVRGCAEQRPKQCEGEAAGKCGSLGECSPRRRPPLNLVQSRASRRRTKMARCRRRRPLCLWLDGEPDVWAPPALLSRSGMRGRLLLCIRPAEWDPDFHDRCHRRQRGFSLIPWPPALPRSWGCLTPARSTSGCSSAAPPRRYWYRYSLLTLGLSTEAASGWRPALLSASIRNSSLPEGMNPTSCQMLILR